MSETELPLEEINADIARALEMARLHLDSSNREGMELELDLIREHVEEALAQGLDVGVRVNGPAFHRYKDESPLICEQAIFVDEGDALFICTHPFDGEPDFLDEEPHMQLSISPNRFSATRTE